MFSLSMFRYFASSAALSINIFTRYVFSASSLRCENWELVTHWKAFGVPLALSDWFNFGLNLHIWKTAMGFINSNKNHKRIKDGVRFRVRGYGSNSPHVLIGLISHPGTETSAAISAGQFITCKTLVSNRCWIFPVVQPWPANCSAFPSSFPF